MFKYLLSLIQLIGGLLLAAAALFGFSLVCFLLILYYMLCRFFWLFSSEANKQNLELKFKSRQEKLFRYERNKREKLSTSIDQENTSKLIKLTTQKLNTRKKHLDSFVFNEIQYLLNRCQHDLNFNQVIRIHDIVIQTNDALLNHKLAVLIDELS